MYHTCVRQLPRPSSAAWRRAASSPLAAASGSNARVGRRDAAGGQSGADAMRPGGCESDSHPPPHHAFGPALILLQGRAALSRDLWVSLFAAIKELRRWSTPELAFRVIKLKVSRQVGEARDCPPALTAQATLELIQRRDQRGAYAHRDAEGVFVAGFDPLIAIDMPAELGDDFR
jgi:hypothetical protein